MKRYCAIFLLAIIPLFVFSQDKALFSLQGLRNEKGETMFEAGGYEIYMVDRKGQIDNPKTIQSIRKKYNIEPISASYSDSGLSRANRIIEGTVKYKNRPNISLNIKCYLFNKSDKEISALYFVTPNQRDTILENRIVDLYLNEKIDEYIDPLYIDSISFAGRTIGLGNACAWRSPHNIHCKGGQMSWSEHASFEKANTDINNRIDANNSEENHVILMEEDIDILFEGVPSLAHRVVYRQKKRHIDYNSRPGNCLIVYYIVQEVRGRYVSCILSNYGYNRNDYELSALLQEVMSIPKLPESAYNTFDYPEYEEYTEKENEESKKLITPWEVRAGAWMPMGRLTNAFRVAPSIGAFVGIPIRSDMAIDLGFQFAVPVSPRHFNYYRKNRFYDTTKAEAIASISLRWRYQKIMAPNVYFTPYVGAGLNTLQTGLKKENSDENDTYHYVETIGLFGGVSLRYKKVGCFIEYQYAPYSIADKVEDNFGNSAVNMGLSFFF